MLISYKEALNFLRVSDYTMRKLIEENKIPHIRSGRGKRFFDPKLLNDYLRQEMLNNIKSCSDESYENE